MRMNGADRRFSRDHLYMIFLHQVKEALEIKRSRVTYIDTRNVNKHANKSYYGWIFCTFYVKYYLV